MDEIGSGDTAIVLVTPIYVLQNLIWWMAIFPVSKCDVGRPTVELAPAIIDGEPRNRIQVALVPAALSGLGDEAVFN